MPTKMKVTTKSVKPVVKKATAKAKSAVKKAVVKTKASAKPTARKVSTAATKGKKKATGLIQTVKAGVQSGIETVGDLVKKVTPDVLLPKRSKSRRK